ncbi:MAG TPA: cysteine desulfurase family protein [Ktedonobacteraceae bacterium]|nr:cysteine desulfurase family protein [Ktedonobacteraceae bacterium]
MTTHLGLENGPIYLDYNATTPVDPAVVEAMLPYLALHFGNPSSAHAYGHTAREAVDMARSQVARLLGSAADEITFTGGGSESDNLAIRGVALARKEQGNHIITQVTEHPAVLNTCRALERLHGFRVTYLPVDAYGRVNPADVEAAIDGSTVLITIMHANNETGTLQPLQEIATISHSHGVLMHTDAAQSVGKISTNVNELGVDLLTIAGHKLYAPKGVGALYIRHGLQLEPLIYGGGQESGRRAGTENVAYMVALGTACALAQEQLASNQARLRKMRDQLQHHLEQDLPGSIHLNGHAIERLPNTLNVSVEGIIGEDVLAATPEIASSTGSACHEGSTDPSPVLMAMGQSRARALGALRLTLGRWSTEDEVEHVARLLLRSIDSLTKEHSCHDHQ